MSKRPNLMKGFEKLKTSEKVSELEEGVIQKSLKVAEITVDTDIQTRTQLYEDKINEYAEEIHEGASFPPVVVFLENKKYWLADGFHRIEAFKRAEKVEINAEIRTGGKREAILYSVGANATHGLKRTPEDKRNAVLKLLQDKEWAKWSGTEIAKRCNVSHTFVNKLKNEFTSNVASEVVYQDRHGNINTMNVEKKKKKKPKSKGKTITFTIKYDDEKSISKAIRKIPEKVHATFLKTLLETISRTQDKDVRIIFDELFPNKSNEE